MFSASYDTTTKVISAGVLVLFLAIVVGTHSVAVGCITAGSRTGTLVGAAIGIVAIAVVVFALSYSPGPPSYTLTPDSLTIHDRFYPVTLNAAKVDVERIRVIDWNIDPEWRPIRRTNGFANAHYRSGWFRVAGGKTIRIYRADSLRLVLLPPKGDGPAVLLETSEPEKFVVEVRRKWSGQFAQGR